MRMFNICIALSLTASIATAQDAPVTPTTPVAPDAPTTTTTPQAAPTAEPSQAAPGTQTAAPETGAAPATEAAPSADTAPAPNDTTGATEEANERHPADDRKRLVLAYRVGFAGGEGKFELPGALAAASGSDDLVRSKSALLRIDIPVGRFLAIGPMFQGSLINTERGNQIDESSISMFDFGLLVRGRYMFDFGLLGLEPTVGLNIGGSVAVFDRDFTARPGFGWNIGIIAGAHLYIGGRFGILAEFGWLRHKVRVKLDDGRAKITLKQPMFQTGIVIALGS